MVSTGAMIVATAGVVRVAVVMIVAVVMVVIAAFVMLVSSKVRRARLRDLGARSGRVRGGFDHRLVHGLVFPGLSFAGGAERRYDEARGVFMSSL